MFACFVILLAGCATKPTAEQIYTKHEIDYLASALEYIIVQKEIESDLDTVQNMLITDCLGKQFSLDGEKQVLSNVISSLDFLDRLKEETALARKNFPQNTIEVVYADMELRKYCTALENVVSIIQATQDPKYAQESMGDVLDTASNIREKNKQNDIFSITSRIKGLNWKE